MNLISFEDKSCERIRNLMDAYLSNELPAETSLDVLRHLERCRNCAQEMESMQTVRNALKRAVNRQEPAPLHLQQKILTGLTPQTTRNYWWLAVAAAVVLSIGSFGMFRWWNTGRSSGRSTQVGGFGLLSANNEGTLNIGLGDHIHCALHRDFSGGPRSFERMSHDMGPQYIGLAQVVKEHLPPDYTIMIGHRCDFEGRNFVHLILTNRKTILSVILTKKNGETFDQSGMAAMIQNSGAPIHQARLQDQAVAGFETRDYLAYVVSGLSADEHLQLASNLAPSVHNFLAQLEG